MFYPAMLNVKSKKCAIVGGGQIALRKCLSLLECEASIKVVSPTFQGEFYEFDSNSVLLIQDVFRTQYIEDCFIVIAATEEEKVNQEIYRYCEENRILVNVADEPKLCSFISPAYFRRGDLTVSISTGGKSPALAKKIKEKIEKDYPAENKQYVEIIGLIRAEILKKGYSPQERKQILTSILDLPYSELLDYYRNLQ
jgi:precorrin-2 dehydrogenase/sirohydrochlorin ferrochelatase